MRYPEFDPVLLSLGPIQIHWYGLMYVIGFAGAWALARYRADRLGMSAQAVSDMIFYGALGVVLGGRLGYAFVYGLDRVLSDPMWLLRVWEGGMSFHGGLVGVLIAALVFAHRQTLSFLQLTDFIAPFVPIGLGAGRIGNFINQELPGRESTLPWAIDYPRYGEVLRHPSALYQCLTEGGLLFIILWWVSCKPRRRGLVSGLFMLLYGVFRFTTEFFRMPDPQLGFIAFGWLTMGQLLCVPMALIGIALMVWSRRQPVDTPVTPTSA